ncbi:MAG TPA: hypothetical protein VMA09_01025 [Candidatus Binataceae bacterium]|nr:hypothetical protein [Candidatus Binataceae bacterium]
MTTSTSIAKLGDVMQMAYVPADLDQALRFWTKTIGAGPFFAINHSWDGSNEVRTLG